VTLARYPRKGGDHFVPHTQIIGLVAEALRQHDASRFSADVQLSQIVFHLSIAHFTAPRYGVNIQINPSPDSGAQFRVYVQKDKEEQTWSLFVSGSGSAPQKKEIQEEDTKSLLTETIPDASYIFRGYKYFYKFTVTMITYYVH